MQPNRTAPDRIGPDRTGPDRTGRYSPIASIRCFCLLLCRLVVWCWCVSCCRECLASCVVKVRVCERLAEKCVPWGDFDFLVLRVTRAGLTIVPVVPCEGPPPPGGPPIECRTFTTLFWRLNGLKVATSKKKFVNFLGEEKSTPEKILATRMRKGPRLTLVGGPRMVDPALCVTMTCDFFATTWCCQSVVCGSRGSCLALRTSRDQFTSVSVLVFDV